MTATAPPKLVPPPGKRFYCNKWIPKDWQDWQAQLWLFGTTAGEVRYGHLRDLIGMLWPEPVFIWDEWAELFFAACCGARETVERLTGKKIEDESEDWYRRICLTGSGASGKSAKVAIYILCCWLCDQQRTTAVLTSTAMEQLKRRIWHALLKWINSCAVQLPLEPLPSDCEIRWAAGDKLGCIFGIPVQAGGEEQTAIDRCKGLHNTVTYLVVDEATSMPMAMDGVESNLRKGTKRHQAFYLGNASDHNDLHGLNMEPIGGWDSITADDTFWLNKRGGCSLHFDGLKSPRLRDDAKFHYYVGAEDIRIEALNGGENTLRWWSEVRGFWPASGLTNTVMDEPMLVQFEAEKPAIWKESFTMGSSFDPAYEGEDRAVLYPFKFGGFASGVIGLEFQEPVIIRGDSSQDKRWLSYSIADNVQKYCDGYTINGVKHPILPENFCEDTTGEGGSFHSILSARWSPKIKGVEFGGAAEKTLINAALPETWHERYGNKVAMIWFLFRSYVEGGQVRGLTHANTRKELCDRQRAMKSGKLIVEPKKDMKGRSPDFGDAACIATFFLYMTGRLPSGVTAASPATNLSEWNAAADKANLGDEEDGDYENWLEG